MTETPEVLVTVVVPTRNEQESVGVVLNRLHHTFLDRHGHVEVLVVDDSDDHATVKAVEAAAAQLEERPGPRSQRFLVRPIHRPTHTRRGKLAGAVVDGIKQAASDTIVVMDGDGQHDEGVIPELIEKVSAGTDLVVASRYRSGGSSAGLNGAWRKFVSLAATIIVRMLFPHTLRGVTDPMTGFFAFRRDRLQLDRLANVNGFKILFEILAQHRRLTRAEVPFQFRERIDGQSKAGEGNGADFLGQLLRLRVAMLPTWLHFLVAGGIGAVVGAGLLWLLVAAGLNPLAANSVVLVVTVAINFAYNRGITWRGASAKSLRYQMITFGVTRGITLVAGWFLFAWLMRLGARSGFLDLTWRAQVTNVVCVVAMTGVNWLTSKYIVFEPKEKINPTIELAGHRRKAEVRVSPRLLLSALVVGGGSAAFIGYHGFFAWFTALMITFAVLSLIAASVEVWWRLYGRMTPETRERMKFPLPVLPDQASMSFEIIVPALNEAAVIRHTLLRLAEQTHPNVTIVATLVDSDAATHAEAQKAVEAYPDRIRIVSRNYGRNGSKALQLNHAALRMEPDGSFANVGRDEIVGIFDAEDDVPVELLARVEAVFRQTGADIVQVGAQLVNYDLPRHKSWHANQLPKWLFWLRWLATRRGMGWLHWLLQKFCMSAMWAALRGWFCVLNCLEYFFWWSSRIMFQIDQGFVPLGGVGVFAKLSLLQEIKGWVNTLTEDAATGIEASVKHGAKIVAVYEPGLVVREETPPHLFGKGGLWRQRIRWTTGFLQELMRGAWRELPTFRQRALAFYTLGMPFIQASNAVMLPVGILAAVVLDVSVYVTILLFLPFIPMFLTILFQLVGVGELAKQQNIRKRPRHYVWVLLMSFPYQVILGAAAVVAVKRLIMGQLHWEKTARGNAHREGATAAA